MSSSGSVSSYRVGVVNVIIRECVVIQSGGCVCYHRVLPSRVLITSDGRRKRRLSNDDNFP